MRWQTKPFITGKIMISKKEKAELLDDGKFMILDGILWSVLKTHSFDDFGATMDTFTIMNYAGDIKEIYSFDEGETFTFDAE